MQMIAKIGVDIIKIGLRYSSSFDLFVLSLSSVLLLDVLVIVLLFEGVRDDNVLCGLLIMVN